MPDLYLLASWTFLLVALSFSWHAGDRADRRVIGGISLLTLLSGIAYSFLDGSAALLVVFCLDGLLLLTVSIYALKGDKFWPLWFASFHGVTFLFELVALAAPAEMRMILWRVGAFWFLPAYAAMAIGLTLDQRRKTSPRKG